MVSRLSGSRVVGYLAVALAGTLLGAGGLAFATSRGGVIKACTSKKTGLMRVATRCKRKGERRISWNVRGPRGATGRQGTQGPQGIQGQQGVQGQQGIQGQAGPSNGYYNSAASGLPASLSLPAGDYVLHGLASFSHPNTNGNDSGSCQLEVNNGPGTVSATNGTVTIPDSSTVDLPAEGVAHLPSSSNIIYSCFFTLSGTAVNTAITAIKVQTASP